MNSAADLWAKILQLMEEEITATTIGTWFDDAQAVALAENRLILHIPSDFKKEIIADRYVSVIKRVLFELFSDEFDVLLLGSDEMERYKPREASSRFLPGKEDYTFERFVVGSSNKFAHAAAASVAENPGQTYNPLFIYGESGLGKTHLLYAIAHKIHQAHPDFRIVYISGDAFTNELVKAIREGRNQEFREKYRAADVFLMDDVQFVAGKDATEEEMFHTFNALYEAKKQIVFTSDRPPREMLRLEDRLKTRFEWGLLADIQPPDYETRVAIIKNKALRMGVELPEEILKIVAENIKENVRKIEGSVTKILAYQELLGDNVDTKTVIRAVQDIVKNPTEYLPSSDVIIAEVGKFYSIDTDALRGQARTKDTAQARQIAMYLIREMIGMSLKEIGKEFDGRDHTTVIHSIRQVETARKNKPEIAEIIKDLKTNINANY